MLILLFIGAFVLLIYTVFLFYKYGVPYSYSMSYYIIGQKWYFTLILWAIAFPVVFYSEYGLLFFTGAAVMFTAAAPNFMKSKTYPHITLQRKVHMIGSYSAVVLATFSLVFNFHLYWLAGTMVVFTVVSYLLKYKNHIFWIEAVYLFGIYFVLIIRLLQ